MGEMILKGTVLDEQQELTLEEVIQACSCHPDWIMQLVEQGVIDTCGMSRQQWRFSGECLRRIRIATRLQQDLGIDAVGAALAIELIEEVESLRIQLSKYEQG